MEYDKLSVAIGNRIRSLRNKMGLSQEDFSGIVDSDRTYICKIENGTKNITIKKICIICESCGLSLKDFFDDESFSQIFFKTKE